MAIITRTNLETLIESEVIDEITRDDAGKIDNAISIAVDEAKMYLSKYDLLQLFGDDSTDATITSAMLNDLVTNIACWKLAKLCNAELLFEKMKVFYDEAIARLKDIQTGKADPRWPYLDATGLEEPPALSVTVVSNPKRHNDY
jgi:hypothetical protein